MGQRYGISSTLTEESRSICGRVVSCLVDASRTMQEARALLFEDGGLDEVDGVGRGLVWHGIVM